MPDLTNISSPVVIKSAPINDIVRTFSILNLPTQPPQKNDFDGKIQSFTRDTPIATSALGTPVMQDITFDSVNYTDFNTGLQRSTGKVNFQTVLFTVTQAKKIITTEIQGRDGTVKEYIGLDDYEIRINGIINGPNGHNPVDETIAMMRMLVGRPTIPIICTYLNNLGIFNVVIKEFTLDQEPGGYSKQNFSITALSDADVILQIL